MTFLRQLIALTLIISPLLIRSPLTLAKELPQLIQQNRQQLLTVDGKPFFMLGGELGNSSASNMDYMKDIWPKLKAMSLNTLLAPVYWELIEPKEGEFDFSLVDQLLKEAEKQQIKLVILWFGSWKNSMSCYVPAWVKRDQQRFPRAKDSQGRSQEILTPFSDANLMADLKAYSALMDYLHKKDKQHTVIMMQVENEIGMLPSARDYHPGANKAFAAAVPTELMQYLTQHQAQLAPELLQRWQAQGSPTQGNWEDVFGKSLATDEIFMAWHFARFTNAIAAAGKALHPIPAYVNAALNRPNVKPGDYPSAGPLPQVMDIWQAGAPAIDIFAPDFYNPDFKAWNDLYTRNNKALFIPEHHFDETLAAKAFFAFGQYNTLGFSPFSIESVEDAANEPLGKTYRTLHQLTNLLVQYPAKTHRAGVLLDKQNSEQKVILGDYEFTFRHDYTLGWSPAAKEDEWPTAGALIIQTGAEDYVVAGTGIVVTFKNRNADKIAGIDRIEEGNYVKGKWQRGRVMNGDQDHQGRHLRIEVGNYGIQQLKLYSYE